MGIHPSAPAGITCYGDVLQLTACINATGTEVLPAHMEPFGALQALELPAELKDGLYLVMVRAEGQGPKGARMVVKR